MYTVNWEVKLAYNSVLLLFLLIPWELTRFPQEPRIGKMRGIQLWRERWIKENSNFFSIFNVSNLFFHFQCYFFLIKLGYLRDNTQGINVRAWKAIPFFEYVCVQVCSVMCDSAALWPIVYQAPLSMGFLRQGYWISCINLVISSFRGSSWARDQMCFSCSGTWIL